MAVLVASVVILASLIAVVMLSSGPSTHDRKRIEGWRGFAEHRKGSFRAPSLLTSGSTEVVAEHAIVRLDTLPSRGLRGDLRTRALAAFAYGAGPKFQLKRKDAMRAQLAQALAAEDVPREERVFNAVYVTRCKDDAAMCHALTPRVRQLLLDLQVSVRSNGREVTVMADGVLEVGAELRGLVAIAGELASFGANDVAAYASLPNVELHMPTVDPRAPFRCVLSTKVGQIELRPRIDSGAPGLSLRLDHEQKVPLFKTTLEDGQPATLPADLLRGELATLLPSLRDATLANVEGTDGNTLILDWPLLPAPEIVARGVDLLIAVASQVQSVGAFR